MPSKTILTQEKISEIIYLYKDKFMGIKKIARKFKMHNTTLKKLLEEKGVETDYKKRMILLPARLILSPMT